MGPVLYHVTTPEGWKPGEDVLSLARQVAEGRLSLEEAGMRSDDRWPDLPEYHLSEEAGAVHLFWTLEEAERFARGWVGEGARILEVDSAGLKVEEGREYPHPVVRERIPAVAVRRVIGWRLWQGEEGRRGTLRSGGARGSAP